MDKYTYERTANYCYKGTDVLINNLNITNDKDLYEAERELVMLRTSELADNPIKGNFDFEHLKNIHKHLFQDVYRWAGNIRNCNIAKQDLFCLSSYIEDYATEIFDRLKNETYFISYDNDTTLEKLVIIFADINALHPFREGNGRSQREFIKCLARINGVEIDLADVDPIWIKENRHLLLPEIIETTRKKLTGHYNYYGVTDNYPSIRNYFFQVKWNLMKWLNRRSQKKSYDNQAFNDMLKIFSLPKPEIKVNIYAYVK